MRRIQPVFCSRMLPRDCEILHSLRVTLIGYGISVLMTEHFMTSNKIAVSEIKQIARLMENTHRDLRNLQLLICGRMFNNKVHIDAHCGY